MSDPAARPFDRIATELLTWPGITSGPGRFGAVTFSYGTREVGHLHGSSHADLPFPTRLRHELVADGRARPHHFLPDSGWVTAPLSGPDGVDKALALFRLNYYNLILKKKQPLEPMPPG
jgi:Family of unknown function (DUF5519)